jgi:thymidylate synthase (FAD)
MDPLQDGKSNAEVLEVMGNDLTVVNAARVSFSKESTLFEERDSKLIKYLAKHNHISPFFHPQIRMRLKMPIFIAREWFRHTVGFARNEVSRRYVDTPPEIYIPKELRERDKNLKQGSKENTIEENDRVTKVLEESLSNSVGCYQSLLDSGVAPEMARLVLPQTMYTEFIETGSLSAYARLCKLRLDPHAQKEIQLYADAISAQLVKHFPVSWEALMAPSP